jgi:hypothetical protein
MNGKWEAFISVHSTGDGLYYAEINTTGKSESEALEGAKITYDLLTKSRKHWVRESPSVCSYEDFEAGKLRIRGYARVTIADEPGEAVI